VVADDWLPFKPPVGAAVVAAAEPLLPETLSDLPVVLVAEVEDLLSVLEEVWEEEPEEAPEVAEDEPDDEEVSPEEVEESEEARNVRQHNALVKSGVN
jgi:hypothetical protein